MDLIGQAKHFLRYNAWLCARARCLLLSLSWQLQPLLLVTPSLIRNATLSSSLQAPLKPRMWMFPSRLPAASLKFSRTKGNT